MSRRGIAGLVVPAAGLGTRLRPLTDETPRELLPLGGRPAIAAALLEAAAAEIDELVVVTGPHERDLEAWLTSHAPPDIRIRLALQPEPVGVLDAIERGRALLGKGTFAVLHPDCIQVPSQRALDEVCTAHEWFGGSAIGLVRMTAESVRRFGPTARAHVEVSGTDVCRIAWLERVDEPVAGALHTTLAEVRGADHADALRQLRGRGPLKDTRSLDVWNRVARAGRLTGVVLSGDILDIGTLPGHEDAQQRFVDGRARWRE